MERNMELVFIIPGAILALVGGIWFLVLAFQESALWGIGCLLCGIVQIIFLIRNIHETWKPFLIQIIGAILLGIGGAMAEPAQM
jgi:hypothetical protein